MTDTKFTYLDYAAATPLHPKVIEAMQPYLSDAFYNPSSPYEPARQVRRDIEQAREGIARLIGAKSNEIIFTAGATESINSAFGGVLDANDHVIVSSIEHHAVLETARQYKAIELPVNHKGMIDLEILRKSITPHTKLVSIALGNSEIGVVQPIAAISDMLIEINRERNTQGHASIVFHCDASQGAGLHDLHVSRLGIDMMTLNAGKIYGPKQVGLLWAKSGLVLRPFMYGGGQENGVRSGTENVPGIIGFAKALEIAEKSRQKEVKRLSKLRDAFVSQLRASIPDVVVNAEQKKRLPHIVNVSFPGIDAERILFRLEAKGILVATGAACAANKQTASHVLQAIGLDESSIAGSLRFSFGVSTHQQQLTHVVNAMTDALHQEKHYA